MVRLCVAARSEHVLRLRPRSPGGLSTRSAQSRPSFDDFKRRTKADASMQSRRGQASNGRCAQGDAQATRRHLRMRVMDALLAMAYYAVAAHVLLALLVAAAALIIATMIASMFHGRRRG